jgi:hypothetical protein
MDAEDHRYGSPVRGHAIRLWPSQERRSTHPSVRGLRDLIFAIRPVPRDIRGTISTQPYERRHILRCIAAHVSKQLPKFPPSGKTNSMPCPTTDQQCRLPAGGRTENHQIWTARPSPSSTSNSTRSRGAVWIAENHPVWCLWGIFRMVSYSSMPAVAVGTLLAPVKGLTEKRRHGDLSWRRTVLSFRLVYDHGTAWADHSSRH